MRTLGEVMPEREQTIATRRRLATLSAGLMLPGLALVLDGLNGGGISWEVVGGGTICCPGLVVLRMSGLLEVVQVQAIQLAALASSDGLTGAPNRRTWDHELSQACRESRDNGDSAVRGDPRSRQLQALQRHARPPGRRHLLREAVAAWSERLDAARCSPATAARSSRCCCPARRCSRR